MLKIKSRFTKSLVAEYEIKRNVRDILGLRNWGRFEVRGRAGQEFGFRFQGEIPCSS